MSQIEQVIANLRARIMSGQIKPDERLMEVPISEELGVSRTPVRMALSALEREGLVMTSGPKRGFFVRSFNLEEVFEAIETRGALEGLAARKLAEGRIDSAIEVELRAAIGECERLLKMGVAAPEMQQAWISANARFHKALVSGPLTVVIRDIIDKLNKIPLASPQAVPLVPGAHDDQLSRLKRAHEDHVDILDAILTGQGLRAEMLMREHALRNIRNKRDNFWKMKSQNSQANMPGLELVVNDQ